MLDVITQKGNTKAAYEGILVLGQEPTNAQTKTIIERQIIREEQDDEDDEDDDRDCDPSYPDTCIPPPPPNLNCDDISFRNFKVIGSDPHSFDRDNDGIGCESNSPPPPPDPCVDNPNLPECDPCIENPDLPECIDPCEVNPDAEGYPPPPDPFEENPDLPECQVDPIGEEVGADEEEGGEEN